ncbi:hypothetical protein NBM05_13025 [Rothia sp. AR01]|uniref:Uncharacterized protein n=1 Tax=Rothia santali TaxID=2949643 RepID=A0A9X2HL19_9MICC|nr:hypothetical protein [Rothia santali]MCP3426903.1 hypothetical protein [Rothia santali]
MSQRIAENLDGLVDFRSLRDVGRLAAAHRRLTAVAGRFSGAAGERWAG